MSYIVCISKDAYKQNNTYYLRKGNTMKKSFVFAAVAATIAASSAMATEITPTGTNTVDWAGSIGAAELADVCNFISNTPGHMNFSGTTWITDVDASVELKQRGAHVIFVRPDHYVREVDSTGNILAGGVAHAVNVDYTPDTDDGDVAIGDSGSQMHAAIPDASNPQQVGNILTDIDSNTAGVVVKSKKGSNSGTNVVSNDANQLNDGLRAVLQMYGSDALSNATAIPFGHVKLTIAGTAELVNTADEALLQNDSSYAITHTVTCLK
jgi:hypothetical protein